MARRKSPTLTDSELRLMEVLWKRGPSTARDVLDGLSEELAYSTVRTTLTILADKGFVDHEPRGRAFVYRPLVEKSEARRSAVRYLLGRFFDGSPQQLMLNVLEHEKVPEHQLAELELRISGVREDRVPADSNGEEQREESQ